MQNKSTWWKELKDFAYQSFWRTPADKLETIIEIILLVGGGTRTMSFFTNMGQSSYMAILGLIYAELLIPAYEWMGYKGKRVAAVKKNWITGKEYKGYNFFNQKSVSKFGLIVHLFMTVLFTTSDLLLSNLKAALGAQMNIEETFAWILGFAVGSAFLFDLCSILIYKATNPDFQHKQRMEQIEFEIKNSELELERIEKEAEMQYKKDNAVPLAKIRAKLNVQQSLVTEYKDKLGEEYVKQSLGEIEGYSIPKVKQEPKPQPEKKKPGRPAKTRRIIPTALQPKPVEPIVSEEPDDWDLEIERAKGENPNFK
ncbi:MAG: hypothetical protein WA061_02780 [Microgenomates group bacterium]